MILDKILPLFSFWIETYWLDVYLGISSSCPLFVCFSRTIYRIGVSLSVQNPRHIEQLLSDGWREKKFQHDFKFWFNQGNFSWSVLKKCLKDVANDVCKFQSVSTGNIFCCNHGCSVPLQQNNFNPFQHTCYVPTWQCLFKDCQPRQATGNHTCTYSEDELFQT